MVELPKLTYDLRTEIVDSHIIKQECVFGAENHSAIDNMTQTIVYEMMDTRERQFRAALIKLGWTPPKDN